MPDAFARLLQRLMENGTAPRSQFSARSLKELSSLFETGVLSQRRSGGGLVITVIDDDTLATFYQKRYPSNGQIISAPPRASAVARLRSAKRVNRTNKEPLLVRAIRPVTCSRDGVQSNLHVATKETGAACLILESGRFWTLAADIAIVENLECFLHVENMGVKADIAIYASGRFSNLALEWFGSTELSQSRFIHCGDYDPVGLDEFLRLKKVVADRARLHIPENLLQLVATYGRPELLRDSAAILQRLRHSTDRDVRHVVNILNETGLGLEQEVLFLV